MDRPTPFLTTPVAVLLGSSIIAISILIHGGVIKLGQATPSVNATPPPAAQPQAPVPKTQADMIKGLKTEAGKIGLDQAKFDQCLDSGSKASLVAADLNDGSKAGVNGTPAFFINGYGISGAQPYNVFKDTFDFLLSGGDFNNPSDKVKYLVDGNPRNGEVDKNKQVVDLGNLPVSGKTDAQITVVEFSDYQCPFCGRFYTQAEGQIKKEYIDTGKVKFYYRDFPLSEIHPGAEKGAEAARCAGDQGKYWQYHDSVFQNQQNIFN